MVLSYRTESIFFALPQGTKKKRVGFVHACAARSRSTLKTGRDGTQWDGCGSTRKIHTQKKGELGRQVEKKFKVQS